MIYLAGQGQCLLKRILLVILLWVGTQQPEGANALLVPLHSTLFQPQQCWLFQQTTRNKSQEQTRSPLIVHLNCGRPSGLSLNMSSREDSNPNQDPVLRLPIMEAELASRIEDRLDDEDDDLKTAISDAKTAAELGIRKSQLKYYTAVSNGDMDAMPEIWSETSPIRCVHPGMDSVQGREAVMESWRRYFSVPVPPSASSLFFTIKPERVQIDIYGLIAICSCVEKTEGGGQLEALNMYKRENGSWKMTLHQAGPILRPRFRT